jgi:DNA-binding MarR family transcriptional regulator
VAQAIETDLSARLRMTVMRLSRLLRPTDAGMAADLSPTRVAVLLTADRSGPVRLAQVAEEQGLNPTLLSRTVAALSEAGLIERRADAEDRRSVWLEATPAGAKLAGRIRRERTAAVERALGTLSAADREAIEAALPALEALAEALVR